MITEKLILAIMAQAPAGEPPARAKYLAETLLKLEEIRCRLANNRRLVEQEHERHKAQLSVLAAELVVIWNACPHLTKTRDSGQYSDGSSSCDICGKEFR